MVFFINENHVRPSCSYTIVSLYSKIPKDFTRVVLIECFWLMLIPFRLYMDSIRPTNVPLNASSIPIMPSVILFQSQFGTFTNNVINCLISPTTHSELRLLLQFVNFPFNYINSNVLFLSSTYQAFCFTL